MTAIYLHSVSTKATQAQKSCIFSPFMVIALDHQRFMFCSTRKHLWTPKDQSGADLIQYNHTRVFIYIYTYIHICIYMHYIYCIYIYKFYIVYNDFYIFYNEMIYLIIYIYDRESDRHRYTFKTNLYQNCIWIVIFRKMKAQTVCYLKIMVNKCVHKSYLFLKQMLLNDSL